MSRMNIDDALQRITALTNRVPVENQIRKLSVGELQEAVATLGTCVNRLTDVVRRLHDEATLKSKSAGPAF